MFRWTCVNQTIRSRTHALRKQLHGQSIVEFALTLPILLLVVTGITTFGIAITNYVQLTESVNVGGRALAISRNEVVDPCATAAAAVQGAAPSLKPASLTYSFVLNGTSFNGNTCNSSSVSTGAAGDLVQGQSATITVTYPCALKVYGVNYAPNCILTAKTTELVQ